MFRAKSVLCLLGRGWATAKGSSKAARRNRRSLRAEFLEKRYLLSAGDLDPTFGTGGGVSVDWNSSEEAHAVALAPDGKIVVAGWTNSGPTTGGQDIAVARFLPDGSLDPSFSDDGRLTTDLNRGKGIHNTARDVVIQPDGKILVAGYGDKDFAMARYNDDGSLDNSFGRKGQVLTNLVGGGQNSSAEGAGTVALRLDGRIVLAGSSNLPGLTGGSDAVALAQYQADGSLDTTFGDDLDGDGSPDGKAITEAAALHPDGYQVTATSMALEASGGIVVGGAIVIVDGDQSANKAFVTRYDASGQWDASFGTSILERNLSPTYHPHDSLVIEPDGQIVVAYTTDAGLALARVQPDGQLDGSFGTGGIQEFPELAVATGVALQADGKIVTCGERSGFVATRHLTNGSLDPSFGDGDGVAAFDRYSGEGATDLAIQSDGKIVLVGQTMYDPETGFTQDRDFRALRLEGDPTEPTPGISVSPTSGLMTTEDGGSDTFTVVLDTQPTAPVTIDISSGDTSEGTVNPATLIFNSTDWDTPKMVTVTGVNDDIEDGNIGYTVFLDPASSTDPDYSGRDPDDVSVTNQDNDVPADRFESQDVPKTIADPHPRKGPKPATSELVVESTGLTVDLIDVDVSIDHLSMSDLTIVTLTSPSDTTADLTYDGANWDLVNAAAFNGQSLDGTWVLTVTDTVKNGITGTLTAWSITVTPLPGGAAPSPQSAAAADIALLAWADLDSSDDEDIDPLATQAADELVLMLVE